MQKPNKAQNKYRRIKDKFQGQHGEIPKRAKDLKICNQKGAFGK